MSSFGLKTLLKVKQDLQNSQSRNYECSEKQMVQTFEDLQERIITIVDMVKHQILLTPEVKFKQGDTSESNIQNQAELSCFFRVEHEDLKSMYQSIVDSLYQLYDYSTYLGNQNETSEYNSERADDNDLNEILRRKSERSNQRSYNPMDSSEKENLGNVKMERKPNHNSLQSLQKSKPQESEISSNKLQSSKNRTPSKHNINCYEDQNSPNFGEPDSYEKSNSKKNIHQIVYSTKKPLNSINMNMDEEEVYMVLQKKSESFITSEQKEDNINIAVHPSPNNGHSKVEEVRTRYNSTPVVINNSNSLRRQIDNIGDINCCNQVPKNEDEDEELYKWNTAEKNSGNINNKNYGFENRQSLILSGTNRDEFVKTEVSGSEFLDNFYQNERYVFSDSLINIPQDLQGDIQNASNKKSCLEAVIFKLMDTLS